ncbi:uncharacterized protein DMAD_00355 [Drosophila madeirensis]|uniref:Uncharacterized protein n=1 Tax=Drosophila madeirensis TaxID=30013 RepID=A0AAU9FXJ0_DROMD
MLRLLSHCPMYSIFCCRKREREDDQKTIADQLEVPQEQHQQQQHPQGHEIPTESNTVAIIVPKQEVPQQKEQQEPQSVPKHVAWRADRMLKRHTRRRASYSPAQLREMCINVEVHQNPEAPMEISQLDKEMKVELKPEPIHDKPIAAGVEFFPSDTVAILHLATNETEAEAEADTDTPGNNNHPTLM